MGDETPTGPDDDEGQREDRGQGDRMAMGIALGLPIGVTLSIVLDNWAMLGVGVALGAAFGIVDWGQKDDEGPGR